MGEDEVCNEGELDNPNIKLIEKKRNIITRMIDVINAAGKITLHKIVEAER